MLAIESKRYLKEDKWGAPANEDTFTLASQSVSTDKQKVNQMTVVQPSLAQTDFATDQVNAFAVMKKIPMHFTLQSANESKTH